MNTIDLQRTAYTVECFLNALRLEDGPARTQVEEPLVRWLADSARGKKDHLIYQEGRITCHAEGKVVQSYDVPQARQIQTLWCNSAKLSAIDGAAYSRNAQLVMLGTAGLFLTLPGQAAAKDAKDKGRNSNNNNNNNNN
ncbi:MAG: hypothetical protein QG643_2543, partial [Pseudomonadota bacterium]|nr:hypothetical protein [Pseudomonadota bacterium]